LQNNVILKIKLFSKCDILFCACYMLCNRRRRRAAGRIQHGINARLYTGHLSLRMRAPIFLLCQTPLLRFSYKKHTAKEKNKKGPKPLLTNMEQWMG
jgi:hypothetical protein